MTPEQKSHALATFSALLDEPMSARVILRVILYAESSRVLKNAAGLDAELSGKWSRVGTLLDVLAECVTPEIEPI
jgi:hypothetical protein